MSSKENLRGYMIIRRLMKGSVAERVHAKAPDGRDCILIIPDKEKIITKCRFDRFGEDGVVSEESDKEIEGLVKKELDNLFNSYRRAVGLNHPNVVEVYAVEYDSDADRPFAVLEYFTGGPLYSETGTLSAMQMISPFVQMFEGIAFVHKSGFLHLNIKAERVLACFEGTSYRVKLTDFGFAVPIGHEEAVLKGTPSYIAPEVALGMKDKIGQSSDLFSAAVLMYACLTRHMPFPARGITDGSVSKLRREIENEGPPSPIRHYNPDVPDELDRMILGLLSKFPEDRPYENARQVIKFFHENWPNESEEMPVEKTITVREKDDK